MVCSVAIAANRSADSTKAAIAPSVSSSGTRASWR